MSHQNQQGTASHCPSNPEASLPPQSMEFCSHNPGVHFTPTHQQIQHVTLPLLNTPINAQVALSMQQQQDNMQVQSFSEDCTDVDTICKGVNENLKKLKNTLDKEKLSNVQLEKENEKLMTELLDARQTISNNKREITRVRNINFDLNQNLLTAKQEAAESKTKVEELEKDMENEMLALQHVIHLKDHEINDLRNEIQTKSKEIQIMSGDLSLALEIHNKLKKDKKELLEAEEVNQATIKVQDTVVKNLSRELRKCERAKIDELTEKMDDLAKAKGKIEELSKENKQLSFQLNTMVELSQRHYSSLFKLVSGYGNKNRQQTYKRGVHEAEEHGESSKKKRYDAILPTDFVDQERFEDDDNEEEDKVDRNNSKDNPDVSHAQYSQTPEATGTSASKSSCDHVAFKHL